MKGPNNQLEAASGQYGARDYPAMTPQARYERDNRFLSNPYQDIDEDRTEAGSQIDKTRNIVQAVASQWSDPALKRQESGFMAGSSIDVLEELNQQPDYF